MNCTNSNLLTALSVMLIVSSLSDFYTNSLQDRLADKEKELQTFNQQTIQDAFAAKKEALIAQEAARAKALELENAKKKLCTP